MILTQEHKVHTKKAQPFWKSKSQPAYVLLYNNQYYHDLQLLESFPIFKGLPNHDYVIFTTLKADKAVFVIPIF